MDVGSFWIARRYIKNQSTYISKHVINPHRFWIILDISTYIHSISSFRKPKYFFAAKDAHFAFAPAWPQQGPVVGNVANLWILHIAGWRIVIGLASVVAFLVTGLEPPSPSRAKTLWKFMTSGNQRQFLYRVSVGMIRNVSSKNQLPPDRQHKRIQKTITCTWFSLLQGVLKSQLQRQPCAQAFTGVVGKSMIEPPRDLDADAGSRPAEISLCGDLRNHIHLRYNEPLPLFCVLKKYRLRNVLRIQKPGVFDIFEYIWYIWYHLIVFDVHFWVECLRWCIHSPAPSFFP